MKRYVVYDAFDHPVRSFNSWSEANCFRISKNRFDWVIR